MKNNRMIFGLVVLFAIVTAWIVHAATNYISSGDTVILTWGTTSPNAGDPVIKVNKDLGGIMGVALTGKGIPGEPVTVLTKGIFRLPVIASGANIRIGEYVRCAFTGNDEDCTAILSNDNSGIVFGYALEPIAPNSTATIKVLIK